jgi:hypothetical protein
MGPHLTKLYASVVERHRIKCADIVTLATYNDIDNDIAPDVPNKLTKSFNIQVPSYGTSNILSFFTILKLCLQCLTLSTAHEPHQQGSKIS